MNGIVSLLDEKHYQLVEDLWAELEHEFGVRGVYITPYPHFSYQIAQQYDVEKLEPILQYCAAQATTFSVRTTGLAIFTGDAPVLYIPVARNAEVTQLHEELWEDIAETGADLVDYYSPEQWMPHITIGFGDMDKENLPHIVSFLSTRDFNWEITVDHLALIYDTGTKQELRTRFAFEGQHASPERCKVRRYGRPVTLEAIERLNRLRALIATENTTGEPFEDTTELLRQQREGGEEQAVPDEEGMQQELHPVSGDLLEEVYKVRERITQESGGHVFEDSAEVIRRMREERSQHLEQVLRGDMGDL